jgi:hypothetical protein
MEEYMFYYDENRMTDMLSLVSKNIGEVSGMEDGYLNNMKPISESGIYGNGIEMIDSQIVAIKDGLTDFKNITTNNSNAIVELEKRLTKEVENIVLPKDFDADNTGFSITTEKIVLKKDNGNKINVNNETKERNIDDSYSINKENIYLLKEEKQVENSLEDNYDISSEHLSELKDTNLNEIALNDYVETKNNKLKNINKDIEVDEKELEDYLIATRIKLESIGDKDDNKS